MTAILLSLPAFIGYVLSVHRWLKIPFALSPLFCSCCLMVLLFWAALGGLLPAVRVTLLAGGMLLLILQFVNYRWWQIQFQQGPARNSALIFFGGLPLILICSVTGQPSVVDDYSFWAIIGKSINAYNSLPGPDTSIFARHLTYTPGLALLQYFFHSLGGPQQLFVAYAAQNLFLLTLLLVLSEEHDFANGLALIAGAFIILIFFSGSILQKLRVDHFLYLTAFVVLWLQLRTSLTPARFTVISCCLLSLYLVKEVGLLIATFLLVVLVVNIVRQRNANARPKLGYLAGCVVVLLVLTGDKLIWDAHCTALGFASFHGAITKTKIIEAFNLVDNEASRQALRIFLQEFFLGAADGLKLPYLVYYLLLFVVGQKTFPRESDDIRRRYRFFFALAIPFYLLYAGMNYVMQYAVFGLGSTTSTTASLARYLNIFFACFVLLILITGLRTILFSRPTLRQGLIVLAGLIMVVTSWPEKRKAFDLEIEELGKRMQPMLTEDSRVCITPGDAGDHYPGFRLLYLQFPARFTVDPFPGSAKSGKAVREKLADCDYLLVYRPAAASNRLLQPFADQPLHHGTFFQVAHAQQLPDSIILHKRF
jgi:hypothetical protein